MATFMLEAYVPRGSALAELESQARSAGETAMRDGLPVGYVRSVFLPGEETCFHVFRAASAEILANAARRASLQFIRITEAEA
jgi:hypothetical protein